MKRCTDRRGVRGGWGDRVVHRARVRETDVSGVTSLSWIAERAGRLRESGAVCGRSWSLSQVCEHLALAVQGTVDDPEPGRDGGVAPAWWRELGGVERSKRRLMKHGLMWTGRLPDDVRSPESVLPSQDAECEVAVRSLAVAARAFAAKAARPDEAWIAHPLLGPMSGAQWRRFHVIHARHHFRIVERTCKC